MYVYALALWHLAFLLLARSKAQEAKLVLCFSVSLLSDTHKLLKKKAQSSLLCSPLLFSAYKEPQPLDAALLHLFPAHRQLLRPQHVCRCRGGELPQVPAGPGRGGGPLTGREEAQNDREKAQE